MVPSLKSHPGLVFLLPLAIVCAGGVWLSGCTQSMIMPDGALRVVLTPDHPITQAWAGTEFEGAVAWDFYREEDRFNVVFPDETRQMFGRYQVTDRGLAVTELVVVIDNIQAMYELDPNTGSVVSASASLLPEAKPSATPPEHLPALVLAAFDRLPSTVP